MKQVMLDNKIVTIREAIKEDAKALIEYLNVIGGESDYLTFGEGELSISLEEEEKIIENVSKKDNALFIVAEINGKIVGNLTFSGGNRKRIAHVGEFGISVLKEYWGIGIGQELIKYLIDWSKNSGVIRKINLRVRSDNTRAIMLYKKMGFEEEGIRRRDFLLDGEFYDAICMGLLID